MPSGTTADQSTGARKTKTAAATTFATPSSTFFAALALGQ